MTADTLAAALAELQKDLPQVLKDKTAKVTSQRTGKTHEYDYADLATVVRELMPKMAAQGLSFCCRPTLHPEFGFVLAYQLLHVSGEERSGFYPLNADDSPQARGSAITYARRYCLCAVTGVAAEKDDDAQAAEHARADGLPTNKDGRLSRSRTTDEQKEAAGVMTKAQDTEHSRLAKGADGKLPAAEHAKVQTLAATPPDDPWQGIPGNGYGADETPAEDRHGTSTADQIRDLNIRITGLGLTERGDKIAYIGEQLGRDVKSSKDLSFNEAAKLLRALPHKAKAVAP